METVGIFLGPIIEVLLDKLASRPVSNYGRREGIHGQLKKLEKMLPAIRSVLADAEDKQMANDPAVKLWMEDLSDLAYDLDDLLDEIATETESHAHATTSCKVRKLTPPIAVKLYHNMRSKKKKRSKIKDITERLQDIEYRKNSLKLEENAEGVGSNTIRGGRETTSLFNKSDVYGREEDKKAIIELLLEGETSGDDNVSVIPIVGMGGIGKTTLAKLVYDDDEHLKGHFHPKAWVCVSDHFDVVRVTRTILEAVTLKRHDLETLNMLQQKLKDYLSGKKFLIVFDDVWNDNYEQWDVLRCPFMDGAPGSKIIVTTRHGTVASTMSMSSAYPLKELSKDECLSLFAHHALGRGNFDAYPNLKGIGEEIVKKCEGLPLAAKTLGSLLRNKPQQREWENILNSKIWDLPEQRIGILPALRLSYHYLPSHLKQCFAYCAIFSKDYEFDKDELVLLWMGVGLLQLSEGKKRMEDFGDECFHDLLSRSFFQQSGGSKSKFVMHHLLNDLAQHVAGKICFRLDKLEGDKQFEIPERARHLSFIRQKFEVLQKFRPLREVQHLRTLLPLPVEIFDKQDFYLANKVLFDLLPNLQCLRVLSLSGYSITELPDSIGHLKHLRYLNLSKTSIRRLPKSMSTLYNLETLLLRSCNHLCKMPSNIGNLINLRHLDITDTVQLREMSSGIGRLKNLQTLPKFVVGQHNGARLKELGNLRLLRGSISIEELQNIRDFRDANEAKLRDKECLNEVQLAWCNEFNDVRNEDLELNVLDKLQPHVEMEKLKVEFYMGTKFPSWIGNPSFSKMVNVSLVACRKCRSLPPLGQLPKLKELCIEGMHELQNLGDEFYWDRFPLGLPFQSLETLKFEDMPAWKEWSCSIGVEEAGRQFPRLRELSIRGCPMLIRVSFLRLPTLQRLYLEECEEVVLKSIVDVTSLTSLEVVNITGLCDLDEALVLRSLVALETLVVKKCNELVIVWQNGVPCINLEKLEIRDCVNLETLPNELNNLTSLTSLKIDECSKLVCFPETGVPPTLRRLEIENCNALKSLPEGISGLEHLKIDRCASLVSWPTKNMLPTTLKVLDISHCENLELVLGTTMVMAQQQEEEEEEEEEFNNIDIIMSSVEELRIWAWPNIGMLLGCVNNLACLRHLDISYCDGVESLSFPERCLPNLRSVFVWSCRNLRSLLTTNQILQNLETLEIFGCPSLESFPERGLPNLRLLSISGCANLRSLLFLDQIQSLSSLESIEIDGCPCLEFIPQGNFHFPHNLVRLSIRHDEKLKPLSEWGLHRLTSLQEFEIDGGYPELVTFPPPGYDDDDENGENGDYYLFPTTLTKLFIQDLPSLESISWKGLQNLTSLQHLWIQNCPKLRSLPKEGLPATLQCLQIKKCPLVEKQCSEDIGCIICLHIQRLRGHYWPKIAHIPYVGIHGNWLYYDSPD